MDEGLGGGVAVIISDELCYHFPDIFSLLDDREEGCRPPLVSTAQGEEPLEGTDVIKLGVELCLLLLPEAGSALDVIQNSPSIMVLEDYTAASLGDLLAVSEGLCDVAPDLVGLDLVGSREGVGGIPAPPLVLVGQPIDVVLLGRQLDLKTRF